MAAASLRRVLPLLALLLLWQLLAWWVSGPLLPAPVQVLGVLAQQALSGELWLHLGMTLARVGVAFVLAMLLGVTLGVAMGRRPRLNALLDPLLVTLLNVPALVVIILLYIWGGLNELAAVAAVVINKVPNVAVTLREGARSLDRQYQSLARVYRLGRLTLLRDIWLPQLSPYLLAASRSGLALIWKIVLVVELMGRSNGVGFQLHLGFQMFDVALILAYSLAFIAVVQAIEWWLLQPWEQRQNRWRTEAAL
ncbi:ABC transporter permease [Motiliproteus sediminis]|uniref:ABC transporter permease n=1 Tax=Motiliproteus sediminis TaxID=1468178 RepID=UPI001AF00714|nr:ABC transporter permease subunit [Motiliproteus sediminis]